jgi:hypothetical protein
MSEMKAHTLSVDLRNMKARPVGIPIDIGIDLSIIIDSKLRVFINKTLSTESLINQLLIRGLDYQLLLIVGKLGQGMRSCKCTIHDLSPLNRVSVTMTSVCQ